MTRLAALADIHGNLPALQAVSRRHAPVQSRSGCRGRRQRQLGTLFARSAGTDLSAALGAHPWQQRLLRPRLQYHFARRITGRVSACRRFCAINWATDWLNALSCLPDSLSLRFPGCAASARVPRRTRQSLAGDLPPARARDEVAGWLRGMSKGCAQSSARTATSPWNGSSTAGRSSIQVPSASRSMANSAPAT